MIERLAFPILMGARSGLGAQPFYESPGNGQAKGVSNLNVQHLLSDTTLLQVVQSWPSDFQMIHKNRNIQTLRNILKTDKKDSR